MLVHVSTCQGKPFWYRLFEPQPCGCVVLWRAPSFFGWIREAKRTVSILGVPGPDFRGATSGRFRKLAIRKGRTRIKRPRAGCHKDGEQKRQTCVALWIRRNLAIFLSPLFQAPAVVSNSCSALCPRFLELKGALRSFG